MIPPNAKLTMAPMMAIWPISDRAPRVAGTVLLPFGSPPHPPPANKAKRPGQKSQPSPTKS